MCKMALGQGCNAATILTNKSRNITVVTDEPFHERHSFGDKSRISNDGEKRRKKGSRQMHSTTLTFETTPEAMLPASTVHDAYKGRSELRANGPITRVTSQPLHKSNFKIAITNERDFQTHKAEVFAPRPLLPELYEHSDQQRWISQMHKGDMVGIMTHRHNANGCTASTYDNVHNTFARSRITEHEPRPAPDNIRYNAITGAPSERVSGNHFPLISGNKKLSIIRNATRENFLQ